MIYNRIQNLLLIPILVGGTALAGNPNPGEQTSLKACKAAINGELNITPLFERFGEDFVLANGVAVTGEFIYSLEMVLHNLDLKSIDSLKGKSVLSLAEGVSGLLPHLIQNGIAARGLDLWYHSSELPNNYSGQLMSSHIEKWGDYLINGDATKIPLESESVDFVISHMLVNNVDLDTQKRIVSDSVRVLKKGGQIRIFGFDKEESKEVGAFLDELWPQSISYSFEEKHFDYHFRGRNQSYDGLLLIIHKFRDGGRRSLRHWSPFKLYF